jgi:hypothetical protein
MSLQFKTFLAYNMKLFNELVSVSINVIMVIIYLKYVLTLIEQITLPQKKF